MNIPSFPVRSLLWRASHAASLVTLGISSSFVLAGCGGSGTAPVAATPVAATPAFSPTGGTFSAAQTVTLTDATAGATIRYTVDGSTPSASSPAYRSAIAVSSTTTINAIAVASGYTSSAVGTSTYTIQAIPAAAPTFTPAAGTYTSAQMISLADSTAGASIYYTLDGTTPTTASAKYAAPFTVSATTTVKSIAAASGFANSAVAVAVYTINLPAASAPTFTPAAGNYTSAQSVALADTAPGATIYYTVDGSVPTKDSSVYSAPLTVSSSETIKAIAAASGYAQSGLASAAYTITSSSPSVAVVLSTYDSTYLLSPQSSVAFGTNTASTNQLLVDDTQQFQIVDGFGAAFTDASAINLEQMEAASALPSTLSDLFTRNGNGIGLSFMLNPIGASDESKTIYTFDDVANGETDSSLSHFSIAHDQTSIIPLIKSAKQLNPSLKLVASPWSPPAWMKVGSSLEGGTLNTAYYTPYANYFVKYLQAYQAAGILPNYLAIQNEPLYQTTGYPSMYMDEPTALTATRDYVLPALVASGLSTKILLYDHNWDTPSYPSSLLADPTLQASPIIAGTAWHGYGGPPGAQLGLQNQYPAKGGWETEHSGGTFITNQFVSDFNEITLVMRSASKSYIKWNLALDQNRGPNTSQLGGGLGGCATCNGIITVNTDTGVATKTIEYYTLGQYSKYILPGATRIYSSNTPVVVSSAYVNLDGSHVLVAFNNSLSSTTFQVQWGAQNFSYTLSAYAAATFIWSGSQTGTAAMTATQQIQGDSFTTASGVEVEETGDTTGSYDLGYVVDGATIYYKGVNFGAGVSQVNVRVASGGNGGTVEFHLDGAGGTLLGTAELPVTGGYQAWQTVSTPVSTATGTHDLYMVFHGSGGIGNVNWFQFQ